MTTAPPADRRDFVDLVTREIRKVIVGQDVLVERLLTALVAQGHVLLEGVPGLAKTRTLTALTSCFAADMRRVQFTPDLLPSDLVGTEVYRPQTGEFVLRRGPVFANLLLADEVNRAPAKVQSALLQAMQERQVTIGDRTFDLPRPFLVLATQNPIDQEGTFPLPEAQLDRFLMKLHVGYPTYEEEVEVLGVATVDGAGGGAARPVATLADVTGASAAAAEIYVDPRIDRYIVSLVHATRDAGAFGFPGLVDWGASPRAGIALRGAAKSLAYLRGNTYVTPDEIKELAGDVLRHRILLNYEASSRGVGPDEVIRGILGRVTVP